MQMEPDSIIKDLSSTIVEWKWQRAIKTEGAMSSDIMAVTEATNLCGLTTRFNHHTYNTHANLGKG